MDGQRRGVRVMNKEAFKHLFYELILKKKVRLVRGSSEMDLELAERGTVLYLLASFYCQKEDFEEKIKPYVKDFSKKGFSFSQKNRELFIAEKIDFTSLSLETFSLKCALFYTEIKAIRELVDSFSLTVPRGTKVHETL